MGRKSHHKARARIESFARQYVILDCNGTEAAIACGLSRKTAAFQASRLLKNAQVKAEITRILAESRKKLDFTVERTLKQLTRHAFADPRQAFDANGKLKNISEMGADIAACIHSYDAKTGSVRFTNPQQALEMLARYHKFFADDRTPTDMGVKIIVLDSPRPPRLVGAGAAQLPPIQHTNGNGHKNGHKTPKDE